MAAHTVDIDVIDKSALPEDHSNIPVINQPNPCYGYSATAKEVNYLMHFAQYCIYESGTNNIINGNTYLDYFPEEGGGGGGGSTGHTVNITTVPNATVTLSKTEKTYTDTADNTGHVSFNSVEVGTYTVTAAIDDVESDSTTLTVTDFSATEDSFASLTISASANCTITVTDGTITKTLSYSGTPIVQYVSLGTWTVSATIEGTLITRTVSVISYSNQSVYLAPVSIVSRTVDFLNFTSYSTVDVSGSSVYTNMKRCNVADDGTINAFDGDTGYIEDGTNGQVMVYVPKFWYKLDVSESGSLDGNNIRKGTWSIADAPADGFKLHPAFLAADGVTELDYFLYGAFDGIVRDSVLSSIGGGTTRPSASYTRAALRTYATNRGTGWNNIGIKQTMAIQMLFAVEYGFNSQTTLGRGVVSAGSPVYTGLTTGSISSGDLTNDTTPVNYRGVENLWGDIWKMVDGINFNARTPYVCDTYTFVDGTSTGYTAIAFNLPSTSDTYTTAFGYDANNDWILLPSESSSTSATSGPIGDKVWSNSGWTIALLGGSWVHGTDAGLFAWSGYDSSSASSAYFGGRLMYIPQ